MVHNTSISWVLVLRGNFTLLHMRHFLGKSNSPVGLLILLRGVDWELVPSESATWFSFSTRSRSFFIVNDGRHLRWKKTFGRISGSVSSITFKIVSNCLTRAVQHLLQFVFTAKNSNKSIFLQYLCKQLNTLCQNFVYSNLKEKSKTRFSIESLGYNQNAYCRTFLSNFTSEIKSSFLR